MVERRTEVHHHHNSNNGRNLPDSGSVSTTTRDSNSSSNAKVGNRRDHLFITGGVGTSGLDAPQIADAPLPGMGFDLGFGSKKRLFGAEMGIGLDGWRFDPNDAVNTANLSMWSLTGDLKFQPSLAFFEPYAMVGLGGHIFNDHFIDEGAFGGSLRLGAGLDLRFDNFAISAGYTYSSIGLVGNEQIYQDGTIGASSESLDLGLKFYF